MHAYILAGGESKRFGSNKAFAHWQGVPFLTYQYQFLNSMFDTVTVIGKSPSQYQTLGFEAITDRYMNCGPLAGLDAALQDVKKKQQKWLFLASCDTFGITPAQIKYLYKKRAKQATLYHCYGKTEPLWGFYSVEIESFIAQQIQKKQYALQKLIKQINTHYEELTVPWIQMNSPQDYP